VRPFAKAVPRKQSTRGTKRESTKSLTDTLVKKQTKAEEKSKMGKRSKVARSKAVQEVTVKNESCNMTRKLSRYFH